MPFAAQRYLALDDFETAAKKRLPRPLFEYIRGGAETNASLHGNLAAFMHYGFLTRVLRDVSQRSMATSLFGRTIAAPFGMAPMGISALMAYRGDLVLAEAAEAANIPMIMSGSSLIRLEDVAAVSPNLWFQAYLPGDPEKIAGLVDRVAAAGIGTLVLTVDTAALANRENNIRAGFSTPLRPSLRLALDGITHPRWALGTFLRTIARHGLPYFENSYAHRGAPILSKSVTRDFGSKDHLSWTHLAQIRQRWAGKLVVKGVLDPRDAEIAIAEGVDGLIVSNHGGRQLDGAVSPLDVLPAIASAVAQRVPVLMDGGVRRGTDVIKALALGADLVLVGRPFLYAAAVGGREGVDRAVDILKSEIYRDMALLGINGLQEVNSGILRRNGGMA
jgi:L-lactate dehydrogenase (cytochrome)